MPTLDVCATCGRSIGFDVRDGVWHHLMELAGQNDGPAVPVHHAAPQKEVA
jgi:hypothetical protein